MEKHVPLMEESPIERLSEESCWELLAGNDLARLALRRGDGVDIFPVNYLVKDKRIYFRSAPGSKLVDLARDPAVAVEIDGSDARVWWSVVVRGHAERMDTDSEILASGVLALHTLTPTTTWNYIRIVPEAVTGRRFESARG